MPTSTRNYLPVYLPFCLSVDESTCILSTYPSIDLSVSLSLSLPLPGIGGQIPRASSPPKLVVRVYLGSKIDLSNCLSIHVSIYLPSHLSI